MKRSEGHSTRTIVWMLALAVSWLAQGPLSSVNAIPGSNGQSAWRVDSIAKSDTLVSPLALADPATRSKVAEAYNRAPLSFEENLGQADARVKFLSRGNGYNLFLTSTEAMFAFSKARKLAHGKRITEKAGSMNEPIDSRSQIGNSKVAALRISLVGADKAARVQGTHELPGKNNYFIGNDSKKWRTNVPAYSQVKYKNLYPGVDLLFYGNQRQLEYDFILAPGAGFKSISMAFDGAYRIRLNESGDLLIETPVGEIRQRKPIIYQEAGGARQPITGGYVIRGEREVGFEIGLYDTSRTLVIDPVFVYSTSIGGFYNDNANAVAVDSAGNAYITGMTTSTDFPTVNPFQPNLKIGVAIGNPSDAFVTKLNPSGTAVLYSTYLGGGRNDSANAIAVDAAGAAYVTGYAESDDFPTTPGAFQRKPSAGGDAFVTKLNPTGNTLDYSTRLGGPGSSVFSINANVGRGIAVDAEGNAYVAGYTFSASFPLKRPVQSAFNRGAAFDCCGCLYFVVPAPPPLEDAFVTKLNPSGSALVYSTYIGGNGQDEAFAIALDSSGSVYLTGRTCSLDFPDPAYRGRSDAFLVKLSSSGREFMFATRLGGGGGDAGNGVAVDSQGNAYIAGRTTSIDLPTTQSALQRSLAGSVLYVSNDGGGEWGPASGLPNSPVQTLAIDPTNPMTIYAGLRILQALSEFVPGLFKSTDGGNTWRQNAFPAAAVTTIAVDPKNPSIIYADAYKSTDGGVSWMMMRFPAFGLGCGPAHLSIDPANTSTLYLVMEVSICGDVAFPPGFFKTTNGGATWSLVRNGASPFTPSAAVIDPKSPSTLYAVRGDLYKSTDSGDTWRVPYEGSHTFVKLAIDPINTSTLYLTDPGGNLFKTSDGGATFNKLGILSLPVNELLVDPITPSTLYAALGSDGHGGGVFKSTDGGQTWNLTELVAISVNALAIDPANSERLYAGVSFDVDGFVAKSDSAGVFVYSTYLGSRAADAAASVGVDAVGNAYVTGTTFSDRFPRKDALQTIKPSGPFDTATFTTKLNATGSAILFSSYVGGNEPSFGSGIAVDAAGKVYLAGTTGIFQPVPVANSAESVHGGFDAFVIKIVSPPHVAGASVSGKNLIVTGEGFDKGAVILVDGVAQRTRNDDSNPATILMGKKAAKSIAPGQRVSIQVRNSEGLLSESFSFTR